MTISPTSVSNEIVWTEQGNARDFAQRVNQESFAFCHRLSENPLFEMDCLRALAERQSGNPDCSYMSTGRVDVVDGWSKGVREGQDLVRTIEEIATNDSLVMLKHVERDPVFGPFMQSLLALMVTLSGEAMRSDVIRGRATILIASPQRVTSYHMDADTNFLFQIRGQKLFYVIDGRDRRLVSDQDLERFHAGDANAAQFHDDGSSCHDFHAGCGLHIPGGWPHWAQNDSSVSVALSLNYDLRSIQRMARIYNANRRLRRLGLHPTPPGRSEWRDQLKLLAAGAARRVSRR